MVTDRLAEERNKWRQIAMNLYYAHLTRDVIPEHPRIEQAIRSYEEAARDQ